MDKIFIKPARAGAIVRHPETMRPLLPDGEWVVNSTQWQRYLRHGDVVIAEERPVKKEVTK